MEQFGRKLQGLIEEMHGQQNPPQSIHKSPPKYTLHKTVKISYENHNMLLDME